MAKNEKQETASGPEGLRPGGEVRSQESGGNGKGGGEALLAEALKAYGIEKQHIKSSNYHPEDDYVAILTHGGAKIKYHHGDKAEPLDPVRVDGVSRKKPRYVAGKKAEDKKKEQ